MMTKRKHKYAFLDGSDSNASHDEYLYCIDCRDWSRYNSDVRPKFIWPMMRVRPFGINEELRSIWWKHRGAASIYFAENFPGTRPSLWWAIEPDLMFSHLPLHQRRPAEGEDPIDFLHRHDRISLEELKQLGRTKSFAAFARKRGDRKLFAIDGGKQ